MPCSQTPGRLVQLAILSLHALLASELENPSPFPIFEHFEALSLQLTLTACWFANPVLNLWDYSRRTREHFPAAG